MPIPGSLNDEVPYNDHPSGSVDRALVREVDRPKRARGEAWPAILLAIVTLAVFCPVLGHQFIVSWDDRPAIIENPAYHPPTWSKLSHFWMPGRPDEFYVPVMYTLWGLAAMAAWRHGNLDPAYFHAINLLAHAACAVMVYLIVRRLVRWPWAAWAGAALFALHPIQVESVAFAWTAYTPLSTLLGFLAVWLYMRWDDRTAAAHSRGAWILYALASGAFLVAMLTKPTAIMIPLIVAAVERHRGRMAIWRLAGTLAPWVAVGLTIIWFSTWTALSNRVYVPPLAFRALVPLDALGFYLWKIAAPVGLVMDYGRSPWVIAGRSIVTVPSVAALTLFALAWLGRRRFPRAALAVAAYAAALLPTIGIIPFTFQGFSTVADHYAYPAMLGVAIAGASLLDRQWHRSARAWGAAVLSGAILACMAVMSVVHLGLWQDAWTLSTYTTQTNPGSVAGIDMLTYLLTDPAPSPTGTPDPTALRRCGDILGRRNQRALARRCYERADAMLRAGRLSAAGGSGATAPSRAGSAP